MKSVSTSAFAITLGQKSIWTKYVSEAYKYDFYHTWDYQDLAKNGDPLLFVYEEDEDYIALPLLKRTIPNTDFVDFHSVYGYTGPISNKEIGLLDQGFLLQFQEALHKFLTEENSISVFVKFHPFINQKIAFEQLGGIVENGRVVAIDLIQSLEEQRQRYKCNTKKIIRKCREIGFYTRQMKGPEDIAAFTRLYNKSMDRIGASKFYKFNEAYFTNLLNSTQCNAKLLLVFFENKMICGCVVTFNKGIIQAHLLATDNEYLKYSPAKYLTDEVCLLGRKHEMEYFHLGGGQGYKDNSLLDWKLSFSDYVLPHRSWRFIVNQKIYAQLVEDTGNNINNPVDFFPLYRLEQ